MQPRTFMKQVGALFSKLYLHISRVIETYEYLSQLRLRQKKVFLQKKTEA
jgi:hypothetical protein